MADMAQKIRRATETLSGMAVPTKMMRLSTDPADSAGAPVAKMAPSGYSKLTMSSTKQMLPLKGPDSTPPAASSGIGMVGSRGSVQDTDEK